MSNSKVHCNELYLVLGFLSQIIFWVGEVGEGCKNVILGFNPDVRAGNSNLAKSLGEKSNHAMYQNENPHRGLPSLQNYES